jgi:hypothetical protein
MTDEIPRYQPDRGFPPYAYVSGTDLPHPRRHPHGHSYQAPDPVPEPLDPANWSNSSAYLYGIDLFNHGYYWEAHEAWEGLWLAAGRTGVTAEFLKGLIKLAAIGIKVRQQRPRGVRRHALRSVEHFRRVREETGSASFAGMDLESAMAGARDAGERAGSTSIRFKEESPAVFDEPLTLSDGS